MGACGDLLLDLICGELIEVKVVVSYPGVLSQICKSDLETWEPQGCMCSWNNVFLK